MKTITLALALLASSFTAMGADMPTDASNFYKSDTVTLEKVSFNNQYWMKLATFFTEHLAAN